MLKSGQRVRVVKFTQQAITALNGKTGRVVGRELNFVAVVLDEPWNSGGNNPVWYGTVDKPMKFIEFELEAI